MQKELSVDEIVKDRSFKVSLSFATSLCFILIFTICQAFQMREMHFCNINFFCESDIFLHVSMFFSDFDCSESQFDSNMIYSRPAKL